MKIIVTTIVDRVWPIHRVEVQTADGVIIATGESRNYPGSATATVQLAARAAIYRMECQLREAKDHLALNGLLVEETR